MPINQWGKIPGAKPTILAFAVSQVIFTAQASSAATLTVTNSSGHRVLGSLRQAIDDASAGDDIVFASTLSGSTIYLNAVDKLGRFIITKDLTINGDIDGNMVPDITIDADGLSGIMTIEPLSGEAPIDVQLTGLNLTNGEAGSCDSVGGALIISNSSVSVSDSSLTGNHSSIAGGAIIASDANLSIKNTEITNNEVSRTGCTGYYYDYAIGGAIATIGSSVDIQSSTITGNTAKATYQGDGSGSGYYTGLTALGGGLGLLFSDLSLSDTDVSSNEAIIDNPLTALPDYRGSFSNGRGAGISFQGSLADGFFGDRGPTEGAPIGVAPPIAAAPEGLTNSGIAKLLGEEKTRDLLDRLSSIATNASGSSRERLTGGFSTARLSTADETASEPLEPTEIGLTISNSTITNNILRSTSSQPDGEYITILQGAGIAYGLAYFGLRAAGIEVAPQSEAAPKAAPVAPDRLIISNTLITGNKIVGAAPPVLTACDAYTYTPNFLIASGAGLFGKYANAEITNSTISSNEIDLTGDYAIAVGGGWGYTGASAGSSVVRDSTFDSNAIVVDGAYAAGNGGGIGTLPFFAYSSYGHSLTLTDSAITGNTLTVPADAALTCGQYLAGGGLSSIGSLSTIDRTLIADNTLTTSSAPPYANYLQGAGLNINRASTTLQNSTVSGNAVTDNAVPAGSNLILGSGVSAHNMTSLDIVNSTIANNRTNSPTYVGLGLSVFDTDSEDPHTVNIVNSIIADNNALVVTRSTDSSAPDECYIEGITNSYPIELSNNWIGGDYCGLDTSGSGSYNPPGALLLGDLLDNGGPTLTHAIAIESAAFDAGDNAAAAAFLFDQRGEGFDRLNNGVVDIGAYETVGDVDNSSTEDEDAVINLDPLNPGTGDGNGDGKQDSTQGNVASEPTTDSSTTATLAVDAAWQLMDVRWVAPSGDVPANFTFPFGMVNFMASGGSGDLDVSLYLPAESSIDSLYKKNLVTSTWQNIATAITTEGTKKKIAFTLVDNGPFDADSRVGYIKDPAGPAVFIPPVPSLAIAATNALQNEGDIGTTAFTFTVTRSSDTSGSSSATYAITGSGSNAADADDFGGALPSGTVSFAAGETSQVITVDVSGDTMFENNENFTVTLSAPTDATIGIGTATGTINNDDANVTPESIPVMSMAMQAVTTMLIGLFGAVSLRLRGRVKGRRR